jgi:diketogulonate reductase-like aldo/keto reductase
MKIVDANGARIPALGLGTFKLTGETCRSLVAEALRLGYRHIDTARMYGNEDAVGAGIAAAGVPRDEIFLTTKIWPDDFRPADLTRALDDSLDRLGVDAVDLTLLHWPSPDVPLDETLGALARAREAGKTRHIGISNFTVALIREAVRLSPAPLVTNQVEYHAFLDQRPVLDELRRQGMALTAYAPTAHAEVIGDPVIEAIAKDHGVSAVQIALAWLVAQDGVIAIPRTSKPERLKENLAAAEIALSDEEVAQIAARARPDGRLISPAGLAPAWDTAA